MTHWPSARQCQTHPCAHLQAGTTPRTWRSPTDLVGRDDPCDGGGDAGVPTGRGSQPVFQSTTTFMKHPPPAARQGPPPSGACPHHHRSPDIAAGARADHEVAAPRLPPTPHSLTPPRDPPPLVPHHSPLGGAAGAAPLFCLSFSSLSPSTLSSPSCFSMPPPRPLPPPHALPTREELLFITRLSLSGVTM